MPVLHDAGARRPALHFNNFHHPAMYVTFFETQADETKNWLTDLKESRIQLVMRDSSWHGKHGEPRTFFERT